MTLSVCAVSEQLSPSQVTLVGLLLCHFAGRQSAAFQKQNMSFPALLALEVSSGNLLSFCHTCFIYLRYQCPAIPILMHSVYFLCGFYYNTVWRDFFWSWPQASCLHCDGDVSCSAPDNALSASGAEAFFSQVPRSTLVLSPSACREAAFQRAFLPHCAPHCQCFVCCFFFFPFVSLGRVSV